MSAEQDPPLSLAEWLVLSLICENPMHGFALAALLGPAGEMGRVWRVPKPVVYRALQRLEQLIPVADALQERLAAATGFDRTLALWRCETVSATLRFLDALAVTTLL
jgi:hypothetical protein